MLSKSRVFLSAPTASACCPACMSTDGLLHGHKTAATAPNFSSFVKARKGGGQHQQISHQNSKIFSRSPELTFQDVSLARTHHVTTTSCKTDWDSKHQPKGNMISQSAQTNHDLSLVIVRAHCHSEQNQSFDGKKEEWLWGRCLW